MLFIPFASFWTDLVGGRHCLERDLLYIVLCFHDAGGQERCWRSRVDERWKGIGFGQKACRNNEGKGFQKVD